MRVPLALLALLLALPAAAAHGVFEASELELHLLSDEGSDLIEPYGGYDITEVFLGFAHDGAVGPGPAGDGFYLRAELYGDRAESAVPAGASEWSVTFTLEAGGQPLRRSLATRDGATFAGDFDALQVTAEGRETHVLRAFVAYAKAGLAPGDGLRLVRVESRVDGDLRDFAPGGIPVPGTDGAATYPDPTQVDGGGVLVESATLQAPDGYVAIGLGGEPGGRYAIAVRSALRDGGQHVFVQPRQQEGWSLAFEGATSASLPANGTLAFRLVASPGNATAPLVLDVLTDVGGRSEVRVGTDGAIEAKGASFRAEAPPRAQAPGAAPLAALLLAALAAARRHQQS